MALKREADYEIYRIPENVLGLGKFWGFRLRNILEGIIMGLAAAAISMVIPAKDFPSRVTTTTICALPFLLLGLFGIYGYPVSRFVQIAYKWLRNKGVVLYDPHIRLLVQSPTEYALSKTTIADKVIHYLDARKEKRENPEEQPKIEGVDYVFAEDKDLAQLYYQEPNSDDILVAEEETMIAPEENDNEPIVLIGVEETQPSSLPESENLQEPEPERKNSGGKRHKKLLQFPQKVAVEADKKETETNHEAAPEPANNQSGWNESKQNFLKYIDKQQRKFQARGLLSILLGLGLGGVCAWAIVNLSFVKTFIASQNVSTLPAFVTSVWNWLTSVPDAILMTLASLIMVALVVLLLGLSAFRKGRRYWKIFEIVSKNDPITVAEIESGLKVDHRKAIKTMKNLVDRYGNDSVTISQYDLRIVFIDENYQQ